MRARCLPLFLVALLLLPGAIAHGEDDPTGGTYAAQTASDSYRTPPNAGYTGPGKEPYITFFEGTWLYGTASASPLGDQLPRDMRGDGDWLVWEDARRGDIYVHNIPAGNGFYITNDAFPQRAPAISGNVIVWEDYRDRVAHIYGYFLDSGEVRRISSGPGNHRSPSIEGDLVAWEDDRDRQHDIYGARTDGSPVFPIAVGPDRYERPFVLDGLVYYRTYRFAIWDISSFDVEQNRTRDVTTDLAMNSAPFTNGENLLYLTQKESSWELYSFDGKRGRSTKTPVILGDTLRTTAEGERMIIQAREVGGYVQLVAANMTSGANTHITGDLVLSTDPELLRGVVYASVVTKNGTSLIGIDVSPFAYSKPPHLAITAPGGLASWAGPVMLRGILTAGPGWTEPSTFTVRINDGAPIVISPSADWRVQLEPADQPPGTYRVVVRATFREGPPATAAMTLIIPAPLKQMDLGEVGPAYHAARVMETYDRYVGDNPGAFFVMPLLLLLVIVLLLRLRLIWRRKRTELVVEYVAPE